MVKRTIPLASMEKLLKNCGAARVSDKAKMALRGILEEFAEKISADSIRLASHAGRKTIKSSDIKLAAKG
jgi:histone H3/H4